MNYETARQYLGESITQINEEKGKLNFYIVIGDPDRPGADLDTPIMYFYSDENQEEILDDDSDLRKRLNKVISKTTGVKDYDFYIEDDSYTTPSEAKKEIKDELKDLEKKKSFIDTFNKQLNNKKAI